MDARKLSIGVAWFLLIAIVLPFGYLYLVAGMRFFTVPSNSMVPTLRQADYFITFPHAEYRPGEIVVLHDPMQPGSFVVKRVIAVGGQYIRAEGGGVFLNGRYVSEPYLNEPMQYDMPEVEVPAGFVFVLGDNRNESLDSHNWDIDPTDPKDPGRPMAISAGEIVGRAHSIYLPFDRIRRLRSYDLESLRAA